MLDPASPVKLDLTDFSSYVDSCLDLAAKTLKDFDDLEKVSLVEDQLNCYPRLDSLTDPKDIFVVDEKTIGKEERAKAVDSLLKGRVLLEHTCAGEATRLGLGTKYLISPLKDLTPEVMKKIVSPSIVSNIDPKDLGELSLGARHMLQLAWDISQLAQENNLDPSKVLAEQKLLIIINEASAQALLDDFQKAEFYGFARQNVYFMIQKSFHGISLKSGKPFYDQSSPKRLHNHGQMFMQTTMDNQIFYLGQNGEQNPLTWSEYQEVLKGFDDKVSFNIEDLDYFDQSLDITGLAVALKLSDKGAAMIMEVVANNPDNPQKGGLCAFDTELDKNVMIESFQLAGMPNSKITYLNKNVNHYPKPQKAATMVREKGLAMSVTVKNGYLYFQPVQGDTNFLVPCSFVRRASLKPIKAWKSGDNTPMALEAMDRQMKRPGFKKWAFDLTGLSF